MAYEFRFPDVGEGIAEGEIVEWQVQVGARVEAHQTLVVMETDKAVVEIPSPVAGVLRERRGEPGDLIPVGAVLAVIEDGATDTVPATEKEPLPAEERPSAVEEIPLPGAHRRRAAAVPKTPVTRASVGVVGQLEEAPEDESPQVDVAEPAQGVPTPRAKVLPRDRRMARELGVDPDRVRGSGPGGRVTEADLRAAAAEGRPGRTVTAAPGEPGRDAFGPIQRVPVRGLRRRIARAMVESLTSAAQVTTTDQARVGLLWHIRDKEAALAAERGVKLTLLPFVVKAVVAALRREPSLNASWDDPGEAILLKGYYHVGVAVETPDGLVVPNLKDADRKTVLELAAELQDLARRARERTLTVAELKGGTFTLSNYGAIGGLYATPILNPSETGVLGLGRVHEAPVARDGALRIERVLPLSLTFDHRVVDGATAQHFLSEVVRNLEDPDRFLVGG